MPVDSAAAWLPDPAEAIDAPERRDEPPEGWRVRAQTAWGGAAPSTRGLWWSGGPGSLEEAAIASRGDTRDGGLLGRVGALRIGAGALAVPNMGLPGETAALVRRERGFGAGAVSSRDRPIRAAPGIGADLSGVALAWRDAIRMAIGDSRRTKGDALAVQIRHRSGAVQCVLVRDDGVLAAHGGVAIAAGRSAKRFAAEASMGPQGLAARLDAADRTGPIRGSVRWRYEQGRERSGILDLEAAWVAPAAAARLRWRSWSPGASDGTAGSGPAREGADDGRAEIDLRAGRGGTGALLLRLGTRPRRADGSGGERYAIGDLVVAREPGRTLRLTGGRRSVQAAEGWRRGRAMGAVLEIEKRRRASFALTAEVVRAEAGAGSYGPGLDVSGGGSLRTRTRTGLRAAARGWVGWGAWRCGVAVDDEDDGSVDETNAGMARAPRVNLWLAWSGGTGAP